jgi:hypothetical protein
LSFPNTIYRAGNRLVNIARTAKPIISNLQVRNINSFEFIIASSNISLIRRVGYGYASGNRN